MLGSAHDGERAAAGLKAHEFLKRLGLCWADVISLPIADHSGDHQFDDGTVSWRAQREFCLRHSARLTPREFGFLINIGSWRGPLTERQQLWLDSIHARLRGEVA
jgi:hypothetical protein